jgi:8-oxo-dGTP pyrophosphatase MutT (NUDIX family)
MLELVGGKIAVGEAPPRALQRELIEEWGPRAAALVVGPIADVLHHIYPAGGPEVILCVYHVDARAWGTGYRSFVEPEPDAIVSAFAVGELPVDEFLAADRALVDRVRTKAIACPWSS